jgi:beta-glucosidase
VADLVFPDGFLWGASTSSYQIEGGNSHADWADWEAGDATREPAGRAADSWNRYREDVELAASLGHTVYRISTEWSRIEPEPGRFDRDALARYADWLRLAREHGMQTMLVLWHFTNPSWFTERGAWCWDEAASRFEAFVRVVVPVLSEHVDWWATINEANTYAQHGWLVGDWPPGRRMDYPGGFAAYAGLAQGHRRARSAIKELLGADTPVGLTHVFPWTHPAQRGGALSGACEAYWNWLSAWNFLDRVRDEFDWLGVQYYYDVPCRAIGYDLEDGHPPRTDMGWRIAPQGLYEVVRQCWERYGRPMLVTENGLADATDAQRGRFIIDHLAWLHRAIEEGADVRGYLHWSLLDNFEWAFGYGPRFGLVEVDYETFERRPRPSAGLFSEIVRANALNDGLGAELRYSDGSGSLAPEPAP